MTKQAACSQLASDAHADERDWWMAALGCRILFATLYVPSEREPMDVQCQQSRQKGKSTDDLSNESMSLLW